MMACCALGGVYNASGQSGRKSMPGKMSLMAKKGEGSFDPESRRRIRHWSGFKIVVNSSSEQRFILFKMRQPPGCPSAVIQMDL
jgi:hypothetical protein